MSQKRKEDLEERTIISSSEEELPRSAPKEPKRREKDLDKKKRTLILGEHLWKFKKKKEIALVDKRE